MRAKFATRTFLLSSEQVRDNLIAAVRNVPIDAKKPLQVVIREEVKARKLDQQALMFAGPLLDISEQAWFEGRQHTVDVLHEYFKRELLPEEFDPELCVENYRKWDVDPGGNRVLVGSTKQLTVKGFSQYLEAVFAFGAAMGVEFHASPNEGKS